MRCVLYLIVILQWWRLMCYVSAAVASLKKRWHCSENPHFQEEVNADRELFVVCCCCSLYLAAATLPFPVVGLKGLLYLGTLLSVHLDN